MADQPQERRTIHFLGGLPRSGSTLLANLLMQNPRFHATPTSGLLSVLGMIRSNWERLSEFKVLPPEESREIKLRVLRGSMISFYSGIERPVIFDKGRGWIGAIPFIEKVMNRKVKIIVPVRDVRDVIASFEKLNMKNALTPSGSELAQSANWNTIDGRCQVWFAQNGMVGGPYRKLAEALTKGYQDRLHLVDYNELTSDPKSVMRGIYQFLGESSFEHDFDHVEQITKEDDEVWKMPGLHTIRQKIEPQPVSWPKILPQHVAKRLPGSQLWGKALKSQKERQRRAAQQAREKADADSPQAEGEPAEA